MAQPEKPRLVGINHIALEVGDVEKALDFYGAIFSFELRGRNTKDGRTVMAFLDMGDQFIALSEGREQAPDAHRHFGLVVDDRSHVKALAQAAGAEILEGGFLDFRDPWGNRVEVVEYADIQFTKHDAVLNALGVPRAKSDDAKTQLAAKGIEI